MAHSIETPSAEVHSLIGPSASGIPPTPPAKHSAILNAVKDPQLPFRPRIQPETSPSRTIRSERNSLTFVTAEWIATGLNSMKAYTWKEAFEDASEGAALGMPPYQNFVGYCYSTGQGVRRDHKKAAYWFKKAAENGNSEGMFNYALISESGVGTRRNTARAFRLYFQAASAGHLQAQTNLAACYLEGCGVKRNSDEGIRWLRKAAMRGDNLAQYLLGRAYLDGEDVRKNLRNARTWLTKAAANKHRKARLLIDRLEKAAL